ncbi:MAG: transglycosylase domain-containing protein [Solirubrobacterales bacterium]
MSQGPDSTADKTARPRTRRRARPKGIGPRIKKLRILLIATGLVVLAGVSTIFGMMMAVASELPKLEDKEQYRVAKASIMYDALGREITRLRNNENRIIIPSTSIAPVMKQAVVAIEDRRFYDHRGVDFRGIARAIVADIGAGGALQGASTITQQFVKNATAAANNRTVMQKLRESALAYHLENKWTKDKILTEYLNAIYFGNGAYGIEAAAETYFGKEAHPGCAPRCAEQLLPWEAALLAGIIASPGIYDPAVFPGRATQRRNLILDKMYAAGYITKRILEKGKLQAVPSEAEIERPREESEAPYFSTWVRQQLVDRYDAGATFGGGLKIHTTLDLDIQRAAERAISGTLPFGGPTASLVAIENKSGKIRALVGGSDYDRKPFNLATQGHRQPGSAFKPFTLIAGLQKGYRLGSTLRSAKIEDPAKGVLIENYEDSYAGSISLLGATTTSDNTAYVRLGWDVGTRRIARLAKKMGISTAVNTNTAMILGGLRLGVTPLEMAFSYTTIANNGRKPVGSMAPDKNSPVAIDKVIQNGAIFRKQRDRTRMERVYREGVGRQARVALQSVVASGTGKRAALGTFAAGKTGTTENYGDAWFVGFNDELTVAIWVGYPDGIKPMLTEYGGQPVAGGTYPAGIFRTFMLAAIQIQKQHAADRKKKGATGDITPPITTPGAVPAGPTGDGGERGGDGGGGGGGDGSSDATGDRRRNPRDEKPPPPAPEPEPPPQQTPDPPATGGGVAPG